MTHLYTDSKKVRNSSVIDALFYNRNTKELIVQFHSGRRAGYADVPVEVADRVWTASSVGQAYNYDIKGVYKGFTIRPDENLSEIHTPPVNPWDRYITPPVAPAPKLTTFKVTGVVPLTKEIDAETLEDAIRIFREGYDDAVVKSASLA